MAAKPPYRLLYNNDTTNTAGVISPWHQEGEPFREEMLVASIEEIAGKGVDACMLSPGTGWVPWWQGEMARAHYAWWKEWTGLEPTGYDRYVCEGGDMVQVLVEVCRRNNMAAFVSLRLNDVHMMEYFGEKNQKSHLCCRFYTEHPEYMIDPNHKHVAGYYKNRGMDWRFPEVADYKLQLIQELCANCDLDGIELDFLRDDTLFADEPTPAGPVTPIEKRIEIATDFVSKVRRELDAHAPPGKTRHLCVRIPSEVTTHPRIGLDAGKLARAGVDMFNLSGWYHTIPRFDIAEVRSAAPGAAIYVEMTHSTAGHRYFVQDGNYGTAGDPRTSDHQFYTTAHLALRRGADGISLFNFAYYRMGHRADIPVCEPPFHVLPRLTDAAWLAQKPQYYMLGRTAYHRQIPRALAPGKQEPFLFDLSPPHTLGNTGVRLRIHAREPFVPQHRLGVSMNGVEMVATSDTRRFYGNPFDELISPKGHRLAWTCTSDVLKNGINDLAIALHQGGEIEMVYIDLFVENPPIRKAIGALTGE